MLCIARPMFLRLFRLCARAAASRTFCTAGSSRPIRVAMMAMTTSSSISVKPPRRRREERDMGSVLSSYESGELFVRGTRRKFAGDDSTNADLRRRDRQGSHGTGGTLADPFKLTDFVPAV